VFPALWAFEVSITVFDASPFLKFIAAFLTFVFVDWHFPLPLKYFNGSHRADFFTAPSAVTAGVVSYLGGIRFWVYVQNLLWAHINA
jgi:hypothetical protein